ncbi:hypothetical protein Tco_0397614 [Tanacetum coccineum]
MRGIGKLCERSEWDLDRRGRSGRWGCVVGELERRRWSGVCGVSKGCGMKWWKWMGRDVGWCGIEGRCGEIKRESGQDRSWNGGSRVGRVEDGWGEGWVVRGVEDWGGDCEVLVGGGGGVGDLCGGEGGSGGVWMGGDEGKGGVEGGGIDIVIKDLDLEPKIDAIMRDFLEYHIVPYGKLNGIPVALVARFGVISKSTDSIDIVIKDLDLEPKIDAIMRDFLE